MYKTRRGIYLNLKYSEYAYTDGEYTFYFSSKFYKDKFESQIEEMQNYLEDYLKTKFGMNVLVNYKIAQILLYKQIEKRGFLVKYKERLYTSIDSFVIYVDLGRR